MELQNYELKRADLVNRFKQKLSEKSKGILYRNNAKWIVCFDNRGNNTNRNKWLSK